MRTDPQSLEQPLLDLLGRKLLELPAGFGPESSLYDAGLDSMAIMQLLLLVEQEFGALLSEADLVRDNFETIRSLARLIVARIGT